MRPWQRLLVFVLVLALVAAVDVTIRKGGTAGAAPPASAAKFTPVTPSRILDTRTGLGAPMAAVPSNGSIDLQVTGVGAVPSSGVVAVALNLTATNATLPGFVTAWPTGTQRPTVSNLNVTHTGQTIPNFTIVRVGDGGRVSLYALNRLDLVADVAGYWTAATSSHDGRYVAAGPVRVLDTRSGLGGPQQPVPGLSSITVQMTGTPGVPARGVSAVVLNVTATNATGPGFVTVWPTDKAQPVASSLNVEHVGQTIPNFVIVPVS